MEKLFKQEALELTVIDRINAIKTDQVKFDALQGHLKKLEADLTKMMDEDFIDMGEDLIKDIPAYQAIMSSTLSPKAQEPNIEILDAVENQIHAFITEFEKTIS